MSDSVGLSTIDNDNRYYRYVDKQIFKIRK